MYPFNRTEQSLAFHYRALELLSPFAIEALASATGVSVRYDEAESSCNLDRRRIVLDRRADFLTQREDFAHELAHILIHIGSRWLCSEEWIALEEREASRLALYLLCPSHDLLPLFENTQPRTDDQAVGLIAQHFLVSVPFARRRFRKLMAQVDSARQVRSLEQVLERMPQYGRDFDSRLTIGHTEYFYRNSQVVFQRAIGQE